MKRIFPYALLALIVVLCALLTPSDRTVRVMPERVTPAPSVTPVPTPSPTPEPTPTPLPIPSEYVLVSKKNMNEQLDAVAAMQAKLRQLGYYSGEADGFYGESTFLAVVAFQRNNGMKVDGLAGPDTQRLLFEGDDLIDATGRIYMPFVEVTRAPTPTPAPTLPVLNMYAFEPAPAPDSELFGGTVYDDGTIRAHLEKEDGALIVRVRIQDPSQLQGALAGTYDMHQTADLERLCKANNAVVGFAGPDYAARSSSLEVRQGIVLNGKVSKREALLIIDMSGEMHVYGPNGAEKGYRDFEDDVYQAMNVPKALVINGIVQEDKETGAPGSYLAFGQKPDGEFVLMYANKSVPELARRMLEAGCMNAVLLGEKGVYTCFGDFTRETYARDAKASNILYFATLRDAGKE